MSSNLSSSRHAESPPPGSCESTRGPHVDHRPFDISRSDFDTLVPNLGTHHIISKSFDSVQTDISFNEGNPNKQHQGSRRPSRRRALTGYIRKGAASIRNELSFSKKDKPKTPPDSAPVSRRSSKPRSISISPQRFASYPREYVISPSPQHSYSSTCISLTPFTTPETSPNQPASMTSRSNATLLDQRRRTITEAKARTHKMAVEEEKALRERMRKNGNEDGFPNFKFVDLIGKGTYGRVYLA